MIEFSEDNDINKCQNREFGRKEKLTLSAILIIITFILWLPLTIAKNCFISKGISKNDFIVFIIFPIVYCYLLIIIPFIAAKLKPELASFDITWIRKRSEILWFFLLPLISLTLAVTAGIIAVEMGLPLQNKILYHKNPGITFIIAYTLVGVIAGPVSEEIFWRGWAQEQISKVIGPLPALFTQAVAFAILHFRPLGGFLPVLVPGLIFGIWRHKRKTLLPVIIAHIFLNSAFFAICWYDWSQIRNIKITTNYVAVLNQTSKPDNYDPNDNAAPYYERALELFIEQPEQLNSLVLKAWPENLSEKEKVMLRDWVAANRKAIEQLTLGSRKKFYWSEYKGNFVFGAGLPSKKTSGLASVNYSSAKLNAEKGDYEDAIGNILVGYRFGSHFKSRKTLIEQLVGISICRKAVDTAFQLLSATNPDSSLMKEFQDNLEHISPKQSYIIDCNAEKLAVYDNIQRVFTDDGKGGGHVPDAQIRQFADPPEALKFLYFGFTEEQLENWKKLERSQTTKLADKMYEYLNSIKFKSPVQLHDEGEDLQNNLEEMTKDNEFLRMLTPSLGRVIEISFRNKVHTEALIATLSIIRYNRENGRLPEDLEQLVSSGYLKNLPLDPYSHGVLVYKKVDNDFMLYSFGADFDDDGGGIRSKWGEGKEGGDQVFWPVEISVEQNTKTN